MDAQRPFLDYYEALGASPVSQDITDMQRHLERRTALYQLLGIPPRFFSLARVLEFGPGLGHNAVHVATLRPDRHVLVDANRSGLELLRGTLRKQFGDLERFEIVESAADEYQSSRDFDIVLAENMIPMQRDPKAFCGAIATHVCNGGVLVVTCMTAVSFMGELLRRAIALKLAPPALPISERIARVRDLFAGHLAQLPGVSRPIDDWIKDNIVHPYVGSFFSIADAICALRETFDFYGGSPTFLTDWRWYKQLHGGGRRFNERALEAYQANVVNLLDCRAVVEPQDPGFGAHLERQCEAFYHRVREMENNPQTVDLNILAEACEQIAMEIDGVLPRTARSFREVCAFLRAAECEPQAYLDEFASYFGRGVQYVSFVRR